jgi:hypothetical protein
MDCLYSFEDGPDIETVWNMLAFLRDNLNISDNGSALLYSNLETRWLFRG